MKYMVKVDGKVYEVEVEKVNRYESLTPQNLESSLAAPKAPITGTKDLSQAKSVSTKPQEEVKAAPAPQAAPQVKEEPKPEPPKSSGAGEEILSPMPGNILKVNVKDGDSVKAGDVVLILEAMKMENEIAAPCDGVISVKVKAGETVDTDAVLAVIG